MDAVKLRVYGVPAPQGSKTAFVRNGKAVVVNAGTADSRQRVSSWRAEVAREAENEALEAVLEGPIAIFITFFMPRPKSAPKNQKYPTKKPDIDKLVRSTLDALTGVVYRDDAQIVTVSASKVYADSETGPPGARIDCRVLEPQLNHESVVSSIPT